MEPRAPESAIMKMGLYWSMEAWRASVTSLVVFSQAATVRRYRSSLVMRPRRYCRSILMISCSVSPMSSYFLAGTVMSAMATVREPTVE